MSFDLNSKSILKIVGNYEINNNSGNEITHNTKDDILTISESNNMQVIFHYNDYVRKMHKINYSKLNREMGFLGTVEEHKKALEKLFNIKDVNS